MSEDKFDLVFKGQLAKSVDLETAARNLGQLFKIDAAKAKALFGGQTTILKRNMDMETANKYRVAIKKAGAIAELQAVQTTQASPKPAVAPTPTPKPQGKAVFGARDSEPSTQRSQSKSPKSHSEQPPLPTVEESESELTTSAGVFAAPRPAESNIQVPDFGIAPEGTDLLKDEEKTHVAEVVIDTSSLSLKANEGNLLEDDEYEEFVPLPIDANAFEVAPAGADVLKPEERKKEVVTKVDTSSLSVGELGQNLAPPKPAAPPPPDTSKISLAD